MAHKRLDWTSSELKDNEISHLLTAIELKGVQNKRKWHERKIWGSEELQDYKNYIDFERTVLNTMRLRRSRGVGGKCGGLELGTVHRIRGIYSSAVRKFPDFDFCMIVLTFCEDQHYYLIGSAKIAEQLLKTYPENENSWYFAARWYAYERGHFSDGIQTICRGLSLHKNSTLLYTELVEMELHRAVGKNGSNLNVFGPITEAQMTCLGGLQFFINETFANVDDCQFFLDTLETLAKYHFTGIIQDLIVHHLLNIYSDEVVVWKTLAQRELKGLFYPPGGIEDSMETRLIRCCDKYNEGLTKVPIDKKKELWLHYIDWLVRQCQNDVCVPKLVKINRLFVAFERAHTDHCLIEEHYLEWLQEVDNDETLQVLEKGVRACPEGLILWFLRIQHEMKRGATIEEVNRVFSSSVQRMNCSTETLYVRFQQMKQFRMIDSSDEFQYKVHAFN